MSRKTILIISDTHIGAGGAEEGNKLEDFTSDAIFAQWLRLLAQESTTEGVAMTLVINGDWLEFLQIPDVLFYEPSLTYPTDAYTDVSVAAALRRLEIAHAGHPQVFQALADFLSPGPPQRSLVILFGNHDPELAYPQVQERLHTLLGAQGAKRTLLRIGERSYFSDGVYIEHGNAYTEAINRFTTPDHPFDPDHPALIERPPGSYVVTDYFNRIEPQRPWIDGVHPMSSLIFYALAYDPVFAVEALKALLLAAPDLANDMLATATPDAAPAALLDTLQTTDEQTLAARLTSDPAFAAAFAEQAAVAMAQKGAAPSPRAGVATGEIMPLSPVARAQEITENYWKQLEDAAERVAVAQSARVVAFGHIHERVRKVLPSGAIYLNTGTWIWKMNFKDAPDDVWHDLIEHPEKYADRRYLTYARIDIGDDGELGDVQLLMANDPPDPPAPPPPQPPPGWWARCILALREFMATITGWL